MFCFTSRVEVSIVVVRVFLVVSARGISLVTVFSEGLVVFLDVSVVEEVPAGSAIRGIGDWVIPAVALWVVRGAASVLLGFCVVVDGPNASDVPPCASVDTSTDAVPMALMTSLWVSEVGSVCFSFADWLVFLEWYKGSVFGSRLNCSPSLVLGRGALCWRRFSSMKRLIGPSPLNPWYSKTKKGKRKDLVK